MDSKILDSIEKQAYKAGFKSGLMQQLKMPKVHPGGAFNPRNWAISTFNFEEQIEKQAEADYQFYLNRK